MSSQLLYIMRNEIGRHKIGISEWPENRRRTLELQGGVTVEIIKTFSGINAAILEKKLHEIHNATRVIGEWFNLSSEDISSIEALVSEEQSIEKERHRQWALRQKVDHVKVLNLAYQCNSVMKDARPYTRRHRRYHLGVKAVIMGKDRNGDFLIDSTSRDEIEKRFDRYYFIGYEWLRRKILGLA